MNQSLKSLGQKGGAMWSEKLVKELQPLYPINCKGWRRVCYRLGFQLITKLWGLHQVKGKLNQTGNHGILQHHAIPSGTQLVVWGFVLMQDNDQKHTSKFCERYIKSKEEQHILQLMFWPAKSADLNPIELVLDEPDEKVRVKQLRSAAHLWQLLLESWAELSSIYFQFLAKRMLRICDSD